MSARPASRAGSANEDPQSWPPADARSRFPLSAATRRGRSGPARCSAGSRLANLAHGWILPRSELLVANAIISDMLVFTNIASTTVHQSSNQEHPMAAVQIPQTQALPVPGTWAIDTTHTEAAFTARHLMVTKVR